MINEIAEYSYLFGKDGDYQFSTNREDLPDLERPFVLVARRFLFPTFDSKKGEYVDDLSSYHEEERQEVLAKRSLRLLEARRAVSTYRDGPLFDDPLYKELLTEDGQGAFESFAKTKAKRGDPVLTPWPLYGDKMDAILVKAAEEGPLRKGKGIVIKKAELQILKDQVEATSTKKRLYVPLGFAIMMIAYYAYATYGTKQRKVAFPQKNIQGWTKGYNNLWKEFRDGGFLNLENSIADRILLPIYPNVVEASDSRCYLDGHGNLHFFDTGLTTKKELEEVLKSLY